MENKIMDLIKNKKTSNNQEYQHFLKDTDCIGTTGKILHIHELRVHKRRINIQLHDDFQVISSEDYLVFLNRGILYIYETDRWKSLQVDIKTLLKNRSSENVVLEALANNYLVLRTDPLVDVQVGGRAYVFLSSYMKRSTEHYKSYDFIFFILNKAHRRIVIRESFVLDNARQVLLFPDHYIYVRDRVYKRKYRKLKEQVILEDTADEIFVIDDLVYFRFDGSIYSTLSPISMSGKHLKNICSKYMLLYEDTQYQIIDKSERIPVSTQTFTQRSQVFGKYMALFEGKVINWIDLSTGFFVPRGSIKCEPFKHFTTFLTEDHEHNIILFDDNPNEPRTSLFCENGTGSPEEHKKLPGNYKHEQSGETRLEYSKGMDHQEGSKGYEKRPTEYKPLGDRPSEYEKRPKGYEERPMEYQEGSKGYEKRPSEYQEGPKGERPPEYQDRSEIKNEPLDHQGRPQDRKERPKENTEHQQSEYSEDSLSENGKTSQDGSVTLSMVHERDKPLALPISDNTISDNTNPVIGPSNQAQQKSYTDLLTNVCSFKLGKTGTGSGDIVGKNNSEPVFQDMSKIVQSNAVDTEKIPPSHGNTNQADPISEEITSTSILSEDISAHNQSIDLPEQFENLSVERKIPEHSGFFDTFEDPIKPPRKTLPKQDKSASKEQKEQKLKPTQDVDMKHPPAFSYENTENFDPQTVFFKFPGKNGKIDSPYDPLLTEKYSHFTGNEDTRHLSKPVFLKENIFDSLSTDKRTSKETNKRSQVQCVDVEKSNGNVSDINLPAQIESTNKFSGNQLIGNQFDGNKCSGNCANLQQTVLQSMKNMEDRVFSTLSQITQESMRREVAYQNHTNQTLNKIFNHLNKTVETLQNCLKDCLRDANISKKEIILEMRNCFTNLLLPSIESTLTEIKLHSETSDATETLLGAIHKNDWHGAINIAIRGSDHEIIQFIKSVDLRSLNKFTNRENLDLLDRVSYLYTQQTTDASTETSSLSHNRENTMLIPSERAIIPVAVRHLLSVVDVNDFTDQQIPIFKRILKRLQNSTPQENDQLLELLLQTQKHMFSKACLRRYGQE